MVVKKLIFLVGLIAILGVVSILVNNDSITGSTVLEVISCYDDTDCNDGIDKTKDVCKNPATKESICVNKAIK
jgi:hypothetical protein